MMQSTSPAHNQAAAAKEASESAIFKPAAAAAAAGAAGVSAAKPVAGNPAPGAPAKVPAPMALPSDPCGVHGIAHKNLAAGYGEMRHTLKHLSKSLHVQLHRLDKLNSQIDKATSGIKGTKGGSSIDI
eukprot:PhM_4_TR10304/c0_g1_i1/m.16267